MKDKSVSQVDVSIMGIAYKLSCKAGEEQALRETAAYLNDKMCAIRDVGKIKGNDKIAVMAALGVTAELLSTKASDGPLAGLSISDVKANIESMQAVLDKALTPQENLF